MNIKKNQLITVGQGVSLVYNEAKKYGLETFVVNLFDRFGNEFPVGSHLSEGMAVMQIARLLRERPDALLTKYGRK